MLGKVLCTSVNDQLCKAIIVETEAYRAPEDKASHAYNNLRTQRTETLFHEGGTSYVYLCYGIHKMFNVVTGAENEAHAVLIRAVQALEGIDIMMQRRKSKKSTYNLCSGPGKLCEAMGIEMIHNDLNLIESNQIWIEDHQMSVKSSEILSSPRVGVDYAAECALWPWRFRIKNNPWTSPAK